EPIIYDRAAALVDTFASDGRVELVSQFASPLPVDVVAVLFGIASEDLPLVRAGTEGLIRLDATEPVAETEAQAARQFVALQHLVAGYVRDRRSHPTDDLISHVVAELAPGEEPLTFEQEAELVGNLSVTVAGAHITLICQLASPCPLCVQHSDRYVMLCARMRLRSGLYDFGRDMTISSAVQIGPSRTRRAYGSCNILIRPGQRLDRCWLNRGFRTASLFRMVVVRLPAWPVAGVV